MNNMELRRKRGRPRKPNNQQQGTTENNMELKRKRGRPRKPNNQNQGTTENNGQQKMKLEITDSSLNNQVNVGLVRSTAKGKDLVVPAMFAKGEEQSDSREFPPPHRKQLIPDSTKIYSHWASLKSSNMLTEIKMSATLRSSHAHESREKSSATLVLEQLDDPVDTNINSAYQALAGSANPSIFSTEMSQEGTEKILSSVSSKGCKDDIQASNNCEQRAYNIAGHNLTEMMNLWKDEDDEVDSGLQNLPVDTNDEYQVTTEALPILRKILNKYGDIASNCDLVKYRSTFVQDICDIITKLQDKDLRKTNEDWLQDKIDRVGEIKKMKVDVEWLHQRLQEILEARQSLKQFSLLKEEEEHNKKTIKECEEEEKKLAAKLARERGESTRIAAAIADAKSKVRRQRRFYNSSLVEDLL